MLFQMRFTVLSCLACVAAFAVAIPATGSTKAISESQPPLVTHATTPEGFTPAGWRLLQVQKGDLNRDGISDAVLIVERGYKDGSYRLVVVFGNSAGGFDLAADNRELLNGVPDGGFAPYPVSENLKIRHGAFIIEMARAGPGGEAEIAFTFRYQANRFILIGYDYLGDHRGWVKLSFNMLTGQVVKTQGSTYGGNGRVVEQRRTGKFPPPKLVALNSVGHGFEFNEHFSPLKYAPPDPLR